MTRSVGRSLWGPGVCAEHSSGPVQVGTFEVFLPLNDEMRVLSYGNIEVSKSNARNFIRCLVVFLKFGDSGPHC